MVTIYPEPESDFAGKRTDLDGENRVSNRLLNEISVDLLSFFVGPFIEHSTTD